MTPIPRIPTVLLVDDDPQDQMLIRDAFLESKLEGNLRSLLSAEELDSYLARSGSSGDRDDFPLPSLILLDLNLPRKDGRQALKELKSNPQLKKIPVVVLTTSRSPVDVAASYDNGANSYISKPGSFGELVEMVSRLQSYWFRTVALPDGQA